MARNQPSERVVGGRCRPGREPVARTPVAQVALVPRPRSACALAGRPSSEHTACCCATRLWASIASKGRGSATSVTAASRVRLMNTTRRLRSGTRARRLPPCADHPAAAGRPPAARDPVLAVGRGGVAVCDRQCAWRAGTRVGHPNVASSAATPYERRLDVLSPAVVVEARAPAHPGQRERGHTCSSSKPLPDERCNETSPHKPRSGTRSRSATGGERGPPSGHHRRTVRPARTPTARPRSARCRCSLAKSTASASLRLTRCAAAAISHRSAPSPMRGRG